MTVPDNLAFGLKLRGVRGREQKIRIRCALEMVSLEVFERCKANNLSGVELQRVALGRALVLEPQVLLLDEPTSNIDNKSLHPFEGLLCRLPEHGGHHGSGDTRPASGRAPGRRSVAAR